MKKRILSIVLCTILLFTLCGLHYCSGAHCRVCAVLNEHRMPAALVCLLCAFALCALADAAARLCARGAKPGAFSSLIALKVKLSD